MPENKRRYCTIPEIFGVRGWFEKRFGDLCDEHDKDYVEKTVSRKEADKKLYRGMKERGHPILAAATYYGFLRPFGWLYYDDVIK